MDEEQKQKIRALQKIFLNLQDNIYAALKILNDFLPSEEIKQKISKIETNTPQKTYQGTVIEGVFDGFFMIGKDGKKYEVPLNYASKSKLVEGDKLKLTITYNGEFIYKQIKQIDRVKIKGVLSKEDDKFIAIAEEKKYILNPAAVSYYKGEQGDEVILIVPFHKNSRYAAIDYVIKKKIEI